MGLKYIRPDGTVVSLARGPKGDPGKSALATWLEANPGKDTSDFLEYIGPDFVPSELVASAGSGTYLIPSIHSLVTLTVTGAVNLGVADAVFDQHGTNPNGLQFTLRIVSGGTNVTWDPSIALYGWPTSPRPASAWVTIVRTQDAWAAIVGHRT